MAGSAASHTRSAVGVFESRFLPKAVLTFFVRDGLAK